MKQHLLLAVCVIGLCTSTVSGDVATLQDRQQKLNAAMKMVSPALVAVQDGFGAGSGVIVSADGIVLTASHVVDSRRRRSPRLNVVFADGSAYACRLLGMNRSADAAMLKITEPYRKGQKFPFVNLGQSSKLKRGDWCFALGHPGGFRQERPAPVRLGRVLSVGNRTVVSDCAIVLGDSGGPLFDLSGQLIGIHSMITEVIVENRHVAVDVFRRDGDRMEAGESWGTLQSEEHELAETSFFGTVLRWRDFTPEVSRVLRGSPADAGGIRPGDILLSIADQPFADPLELSSLLTEVEEDQNVNVTVERSGKEVSFKLITGHRPSDRELAELGDDEITSEEQEHYRELKNQLTSFRRVGPYEKRSAEEMERFEPIVKGSSSSVVEFRELGRTLALGTIMSRDGYILTKASELQNSVDPECILADGRRLRIEEIATDAAYDLMLVRVNASNLKPVEWAQEKSPDAGTILISTDARGTPILPGVVSVPARKLPTANKGFLGVQMTMAGNPPHVVLTHILPGGAAERDGLKAEDVVIAINNTKIFETHDMTETVGSFPPNAKIAVLIQRGGVAKTIDVVLTPRFVAEQDDVLLERYSNSSNSRSNGKFSSSHNSGFPLAIEHDTDLFPNQCGGPLLNISGKAVGLNIARVARINSYAIPAAAVLETYNQLKAKAATKVLKKAS